MARRTADIAIRVADLTPRDHSIAARALNLALRAASIPVECSAGIGAVAVDDADTSIWTLLLSGGLHNAARGRRALCIRRAEDRPIERALLPVIALLAGIEGAVLTNFALADIVASIPILRAALPETELRTNARIRAAVLPRVSITLLPIVTLLLRLGDGIPAGGAGSARIARRIKVAAFP